MFQPNKRRGKPPIYEYTHLSKIRSRTTINVYAVVKYVKQPYKSNGTDYCMVLSLIDSTCYGLNKLKCLLFFNKLTSFPPLTLGCIVRFHRLKIGAHAIELQGTNGAGFSWVVFNPTLDSTFEPVATMSKNWTFNDIDKKFLREIRQWLATAGVNYSQEEIWSNLHQTSIDEYMNVICQVVGKSYLLSENCIVLHVWDGMRSRNRVRKVDSKNVDRVIMDHCLLECARQFVYDVFVYDDHQESADSVLTGDIVKLNNLHTCKCKVQPASYTEGEEPCIELIIHRGTTYGRGLIVIPPTAPEATDVIEKLRRMKDLHLLFFDDSFSQQTPHLGEFYNYDDFGEVLENFDCPASENDRCLLKTQTLVLGHQNVTCSTISDVTSQERQYKYKLQCYLLDYFPKTIHEALKLYCEQCSYRVNSTTDQRQTPCPQCNFNSSGRSPHTVFLKETMAFKLVLLDKTGWLFAYLWGTEADKFFGLPKRSASKYRDLLNLSVLEDIQIRNGKHRDDCLLECCVVSYYIDKDIYYQIFDTKLIKNATNAFPTLCRV